MNYLKILSTTMLFLLSISLSFAQQNDYKKLLSLSYLEIDSLVMIEYRKGAYDKAIPYMQAGREKARVDYNEQDSFFGLYTGNLAFFYEQVGEYEQALPLYLQSMNIQEKH